MPLAVVGGHGGMLSVPVSAATMWLCPALTRERSLRGLVYKPLAPAPDARGARERAFYLSAAAAARPCGGRMASLASLLPALCGEAPGALVLEDVTAACAEPCILDVKLGVVATGPDASPLKAAAEAAKCPSQAVLGLRLTGMRVSGGDGSYRARGRSLRGEISATTLADTMRDFLSGSGGATPRSALAAPILRRLLLVRGWVVTQREWRLFGSSLLIVYDAARRPTGTDADAADDAATVHMIDFAHAWRVESLPAGTLSPGEDALDAGYLCGLDNLIAALLDVLADVRPKTALLLQDEWLSAFPRARPLVIPPYPFKG